MKIHGCSAYVLIGVPVNGWNFEYEITSVDYNIGFVDDEMVLTARVVSLFNLE